MDNCWISCQVMADMKKAYDDLTIIDLYTLYKVVHTVHIHTSKTRVAY